jgi:hypothetical protein
MTQLLMKSKEVRASLMAQSRSSKPIDTSQIHDIRAVIPAKARIQVLFASALDSGLRRNDARFDA